MQPQNMFTKLIILHPHSLEETKLSIKLSDIVQYNIVTFNCVPVTIVAVQKQWVLHMLSMGICSLSYPASKAQAPYYILPAVCPAVPYFFHAHT